MRSRPQRSVPQFHEEIKRTRSQGSSEFQRGEETRYFLPHHPVSKEIISATRTRVAFGGRAKLSNGTQ